MSFHIKWSTLWKLNIQEVEPDNFPNFLDVHDDLLTHMIVPHFLQFSGYDCSSFSSSSLATFAFALCNFCLLVTHFEAGVLLIRDPFWEFMCSLFFSFLFSFWLGGGVGFATFCNISHNICICGVWLGIVPVHPQRRRRMTVIVLMEGHENDLVIASWTVFLW